MSLTKLTPDLWTAAVPAAMKALPNWVRHSNKRPVQIANGGLAADATDPATWGKFEDAARIYGFTHRHPAIGIGFALDARADLVFVDFDHVLRSVEQGEGGRVTRIAWRADLDPRVREIGEQLLRETYAEVSPSGEGLHFFIRGRLPANAAHSRRWHFKTPEEYGVEVYDSKRYSTITGAVVGKESLDAAPRRVVTLVEIVGTREVSAANESQNAEPERVDEVAEALTNIDPDVPYPDWLRVGMGLKCGLGDAGKRLWVEWSWQGAKFKPGEPERKWASFKKNGVGLGTVLWMAEQNGWDSRPWRERRMFENVIDLPATGAATVPDVKPVLPEADFVPPGIVGEIAEWVYDNAAVPSRAASLAAALVVGSAATRNRYEIESLRADALNLYVVLVAPTGAGKEDARVAAKALAEAGGFSNQLVESMASGPAMLRALEAGPERLVTADEWGHVLKEGLRSSGDSNHVASFIRELLTMYGLGRSYYAGKKYADKKQNIGRIERPFVNLLATTTLDTMVEALRGEEVRNGFVNRQLILYADGAAPEPRFKRPEKVPERIARALQRFANPFAGTGFALEEEHARTRHRVIRFTPDAEMAFKNFRAECTKKGDLWVRAAQNAQRVAAILAAVDTRYVTAKQFAWAERFVRWSLERTECELEANMAENPFERLAKRALRFIRSARDYADDRRWGPLCERGLMPRAELLRLMHVKARDLDEVTAYLVQTEQIVPVSERVPGRQRPVDCYRASPNSVRAFALGSRG